VDSGIRGIIVQVIDNQKLPSNYENEIRNENFEPTLPQKSDQELIENWLDLREKEYGFKGIDTRQFLYFYRVC